MTAIADRPGSATGGRFALFARDIKIHHTVFALPFALLSAFLAADGVPRPGILLLILLCMVTARTTAMAVNRLLDAKLDALNPRTARRPIPSGAVSRRLYFAMSLVCAALFIVATAGFLRLYANPLPRIFSVPVLLFLTAYPLLKRFTRLCHYWLGAALGLAPICAWIAVRGDLRLPPVLIAIAVLFWTAGFDILYACQDYQADVACGLFSVPSRLGIRRALIVARLTHAVAAAALIALGFSTPDFGRIYLAAAALAVALLIAEHAVVSERNLSRIGLAFFTLNGILSVAIAALGITDILLH